MTLTWSEPANTGPTVNDYDIQYRRRGTTSWTAWPHTGTARTATITGLTANTTYELQVRATNPEGSSRWSTRMSATTAEAETTTTPGETASGDCYVGLVLSPGEMCTYPGSSQILSVDSNGKGRWSAIPFVSFSGPVDFTVGSERFAAHPQGDGTWMRCVLFWSVPTPAFAAHPQGDGTWIIDAAG